MYQQIIKMYTTEPIFYQNKLFLLRFAQKNDIIHFKFNAFTINVLSILCELDFLLWFMVTKSC